MTSLAIGGMLVAVLFLAAWAWARKIDNYSVVDAVWAFGIGITAVLWLALGNGEASKRVAATGLVMVWSSRLGIHLSKRIHRAHPKEDPRYKELRERWKHKEAAAFFAFFQIQALSVLVLALPFLLIARDPSAWGFWESVGSAVAVAGISGEALADRQMAAFLKNRSDPKEVCREGLWRYSRHPNYFFESVIWFGFYLFACGSEGGWATLHAPLIILWLLLKVTGIPPAEASSLASKGERYREYQRTTSAFVPLPPKPSSKP